MESYYDIRGETEAVPDEAHSPVADRSSEEAASAQTVEMTHAESSPASAKE